MPIIIVILIGFILDCIFGDPNSMPHPVRLMGFLISKGDKILRREKHSKILSFVFGMLLSIFVITFSFLSSFYILKFLYDINFYIGIIAESFFCYQIFAAKSLKDESMKVYYALEKNDITNARIFLSYIVGRDTENLSEEQITRATVETVAENLSDGVIAPMFFMLIAGAPLGLLYKAINTLDSMIGYNNKKYSNFGKFAARLDDVANFLPSRIAAISMIISSFFCKMNYQLALKIFIRDRYQHISPNSAQTEAVCAGALEISLSGDNYYGGVLVKKPIIGDSLRKINRNDIKLTNRLMYVSTILVLTIGLFFRLMFL